MLHHRSQGHLKQYHTNKISNYAVMMCFNTSNENYMNKSEASEAHLFCQKIRIELFCVKKLVCCQ